MCEHKWNFQGSDYKRTNGTYNDTFTKIDIYYCEKCLERKEIIAKHESSRYEPYWYGNK